MNRLVPLAALACWCGAAVLLGETRWARRPGLADRVRPYLPGRSRSRIGAGVLSAASFRDVLGPVARQLGARAARTAGVQEELEVRLSRIHAPVDAAAFRLRQLGWVVAALGIGSVVAVAGGPPPVLATLLVLGTPALAFLIVEQRLSAASLRWQRQTAAELPVVAEQLGMLLSAGYSVGAALHRMAARGTGVVATDLGRVCRRIGHGVGEADGLREWSELARVDAVSDLVAVLVLDRETTDLGRLVSDEARAMRRDAQRRRIEEIERRGQQVWIPVTVAALVPGVLFLAAPFVDAMRLFGAA